MSTQAQPLIDYLAQLQANGQTHVMVDDEARQILRQFYQNTRNRATPDQPPVVIQEKKTNSPSVSTPEPVRQVVEPASDVTSISVDGSSAKEKISSLRKQAEKWQPALSLGTLRSTMVFSAGDPEADIMLVGEAPGFDEERLGEPFVGKAGQKLNDILRAMGVQREKCYLSNIVKFRPKMANQTTNNRKPSAEEITACIPFIQQEIQIVQPKVIIALGGTAAQALLNSKDAVSKMRGSFHDFSGTSLRVTYHPSYILHNEATSEKRKLWEDMLEVMQLLNMPISDKQQSYFLPK